MWLHPTKLPVCHVFGINPLGNLPSHHQVDPWPAHCPNRIRSQSPD